MAIYARHARTSPASRRVDTLFLHTTMWGLYLLFLFAYPDNRVLLELPKELPGWGRWLIGLAYGAIVLEFLAYGAYLLVRKQRGESLKPALFVLVQAFGIATFAYFIVGAFEPIHPHPVTFEQHILAVAFVVGIVHGLQYLGIIIAVSRRRYAAAGDGIAARMGRRPIVAYALLVAASVGYLALNAARGDGPGVAW